MAFRVTRPPQASNQKSWRAFDSSDEEEVRQDEMLAGYSAKGSIRKGQDRVEKAKPLVIPSQPNADWREIAKQRRQRAAIYLPDGVTVDGKAETPLLTGHADVINAKPVVGGLKLPAAASPSPALSTALAETSLDTPSSGGALTPAEAPIETEDQRALRELLGGATSDEAAQKKLDAISIAPDSLRTRAPTEDDAFRMDVEGRPEVSTIEDYERVPIDQFGAAMLRGMGWKPSETQEAHVPQRRSALLGLGAKESSISLDDGKSKAGKSAYKKPEPRFMPLVRKESESARSSQPSSRDRSRSPTSREASEDERRRRVRDRDYDSDRDRRRHRDSERSRSRERERSHRDRYSDDESRRRALAKRDERDRYDSRRSRDYDSRRYERELNGR